jgi:quinol monooxygenase YgiN
MLPMDETPDQPEGPISTLVEWQAPNLSPEEARTLAQETIERIGHFPGFVEGRFFGDFENGTHFYLLTWRDRAALDAYAASEQMTAVRDLAGPFVQGKPTRKILTDYSVR